MGLSQKVRTHGVVLEEAVMKEINFPLTPKLLTPTHTINLWVMLSALWRFHKREFGRIKNNFSNWGITGNPGGFPAPVHAQDGSGRRPPQHQAFVGRFYLVAGLHPIHSSRKTFYSRYTS